MEEHPGKIQKTTFTILKMDCPTEEQLIRMKLADLQNIESLEFEIAQRQLTVFHTGNATHILELLNMLNFGPTLTHSVPARNFKHVDTLAQEKKLLWQVLAVNFFFFFLEITTGFISNSMGLVADSLDMLADSLVYGLALFAVGGTISRKKNIAKYAGYLQFFLAVLGFGEVIRRFAGHDETPAFQTMIAISLLALAGNAFSLFLLQKNKSRDAHMRAGLIFTSNDIIVNIGVMAAGALVYVTQSRYPDLVVGTIVFFIVARGAFKILKLSNN